MRATTWPASTSELKSASSSLICPDTCEPTMTVMTAFSVPVVDTALVIGPRSTAAIRYRHATVAAFPQYPERPAGGQALQEGPMRLF